MSTHGYTGRLFEGEVFGRCPKHLLKLKWHGGYVPYQKGMTIAKQCQPDNPAPVAKTLRTFIAKALRAEGSAVKFYTSIDSPLDRHGVDGFFEYNDVVVTIDLTINSCKNSDKADIVMREEDVYTEDGQVNQSRLQEFSQFIAKLLRRRAGLVAAMAK